MPTPQSGDAARDEVRQRLLAALAAPLPPVRIGFLYVLGLLFVSVVMILLPLIYLAIVAATCFGLYYHATANVSLFAEVRGRAALLMYVTPLVVGGVMVLFMIKPLFVGRPRAARPYRLSREKHPFFFTFVERLCRAVGAPVPREIHLDCDVNASAAPRGGLFSLLTKNLVLTVGTPLVVGLSVSEFAGVIAHEFGHFAQRAGMVFGYLIRRVNAWFARVVYERDSWDEWLESTVRDGGRLGLVLLVAQLFVWLTRRILWVLMMFGHGLSCFMSRQMEYDADRYEMNMSGSAGFERTMGRMPELMLAVNGAQSDMQRLWAEGRLPDDYAALVESNLSQIPERVKREMMEQVHGARTGLLATHPADRDRVAAAKRRAAKGILSLETPATVLFDDFPAVSRELSMELYCDVVGRGEAKRAQVVSTAEIAGDHERELESFASARRMFQGAVTVLRPPVLPSSVPAAPADLAKAKTQLEAVRNNIVAAAAAYRDKVKAFDEADTATMEAHAAGMFARAGLEIRDGEFGLMGASPEATRAKAEAMRSAATEGMQRFESVAAKRLAFSLSLLRLPEVAARLPEANQYLDEAAGLLPAAAAVSGQFERLLKMRNDHRALFAFTQRLQEGEQDEAVLRRIHSTLRRVNESIAAVSAGLESVPYPFEHSKKNLSAARFALNVVPDREDLVGNIEGGAMLLEQLYGLYGRIFARLSLIAERAEGALGFEPLPEPPEEA